MDKLTLEIVRAFIKDNPIELSPTQYALCFPIMKRIYQKMVSGIKFDDIKTCDGLVIDGHHRYLCSLLSGKEIGRVSTHQTSATKKYDWGDVELVEIDWDTESKIEKLNREDAEFNNIPIHEIIQMTK